jgi:hypothetical protein
VEETHSFNSALINTARFGFNREPVQNNWSVKAINPAAADTSLAAVPGSYPAVVTVGGISPFLGGTSRRVALDLHMEPLSSI